MSPKVFFTTERIDSILVIALIVVGIISIVILNPLPTRRPKRTRAEDEIGVL
jgi:type II secretory pathway pseudopilin PulG